MEPHLGVAYRLRDGPLPWSQSGYTNAKLPQQRWQPELWAGDTPYVSSGATLQVVRKISLVAMQGSCFALHATP
jgi:hypothetical protein